MSRNTMNDPNDYPASASEVLNRKMKFRPAAIQALRRFSRSKPWLGSLIERQAKFRVLHAELCQVYGIHPQLVLGNDDATDSGRSCFIPAMNAIVLRGRLSVVTYLHELAHARGMGERDAVGWSVSAYFRFFPKSFARCHFFDGHMVRSPSKDSYVSL